MSAPPPADLVHALNALYGTDPALQQQANAWLEQYSSTAAAWDGALSLISPAVPLEAQFFGCNMLLTKIRRDWGSLAPHESQHILQRIEYACTSLYDTVTTNNINSMARAVLSQPATPPLVADRWCLVEASLAIATCQVQASVNHALQALGTAPHPGAHHVDSNTPDTPAQAPCASWLPLQSSSHP